MKTFYAFLQELSAEPSTLQRKIKMKSGLLNGPEWWLDVFKAALDPDVTYGIQLKDGSWVTGTELTLEQWENIRDGLGRIARREVTGGLALDLAEEMRRKWGPWLVWAILRKNLKCGVTWDMLVKAGLVRGWACMLAKEGRGVAGLANVLRKKRETRWIAEPKIVGVRCLVRVDVKAHEDLRVGIYSRTGKRMDYLVKLRTLMSDMTPGWYDGVLVSKKKGDGGGFEASVAAARSRDRGRSGELDYWVFDYLTLEEWDARDCALGLKARKARMGKVMQLGENGTIQQCRVGIIGVMGYDISERRDAESWWADWRHKGHKGRMLKSGDGLYSWRRSGDWLKFKI